MSLNDTNATPGNSWCDSTLLEYEARTAMERRSLLALKIYLIMHGIPVAASGLQLSPWETQRLRKPTSG